MAKNAYVGVGNTSRRMKKVYIGVGGVARRIKKAYIGINGVARLFYSSDMVLSPQGYQTGETQVQTQTAMEG